MVNTLSIHKNVNSPFTGGIWIMKQYKFQIKYAAFPDLSCSMSSDVLNHSATLPPSHSKLKVSKSQRFSTFLVKFHETCFQLLKLVVNSLVSKVLQIRIR